ncbi:MAG TPA: helix-turn-helix domain-containing protein [Caulobacteraceae bacterium]|nr:helix-turn-helix domain-containing protein [Caulobacteraceae bacterium]
MIHEASALELMLRGLAVGALLATIVGVWRSAVERNAKVATAIFCIASAGYVLDAYGVARQVLGAAQPICWLLDAGVPGCVWLMIMVVFEDRKVTPVLLAPAAAQIALDAYGLATHGWPSAPAFFARDVISVVLAAHALFVVIRSWRGDLVEDRRRLRGPFLAVVTVFVAVQTVLDASLRSGAAMPWLPLANSAMMAALTVAGASVFLTGRGTIFGLARAPAKTDGQAEAIDEAALARLTRAMDEDRLWKQEGLTIAALAAKVAIPEHRLRRLINDRLGHRNFADFVNSRRIEAAKQALVDPGQARTTVAAIAYDLGFASLGPFNRAFRASTGVSPREWRAQQPAE